MEGCCTGMYEAEAGGGLSLSKYDKHKSCFEISLAITRLRKAYKKIKKYINKSINKSKLYRTGAHIR